MTDDKKEKQLNIELNEDVAEGVYSNLAIITHSNAEFVVDFVRIMPGVPKAKVKSRIVLTPEHAKRLMLALQDNIRKYEQLNGPIKNIGDKHGSVIPPISFTGPAGEA